MSLLFLIGKDLFLLLGKWIQSLSNGNVGKWVLSGLVMESNISSGFSKFGLNLIRVDDS